MKLNSLEKEIGYYFKNKDLVSIEDLISLIEDLADEAEHWKEKFEDLEEEVRENYKPIPIDLGLSDRDFI